MARIGNEVKLILRLASEQQARKWDLTKGEQANGITDYYRGFRAGMDWYEQTLQSIVSELESK